VALPRPPAGTVRVAVNGHHDTSQWTNVFWLLVTNYDLADGLDVADLATQIFDAFGARLIPWTSNSNHLTSVQCVLYQTGGELMGTAGGDTTGGASGSYQVGAVSIILSWGTTAFWRGGKPRTYLSGIPDSAIATATTFTSGYVSAVNTAAALYLSDVDTITTTNIDTVTLGFLSRVSGGAPRTPGIFFPYTTVFTRTNPGSIRRRNEYTGI
jgi:hypothetical protein